MARKAENLIKKIINNKNCDCKGDNFPEFIYYATV